VCEYVHLNPVRAKLLTPEQALRAYRWSSLGEYLKAPSRRLVWLRMDRVFGEMGILKDSAAGRRRFEEVMERTACGGTIGAMETGSARLVSGGGAIPQRTSGTGA